MGTTVKTTATLLVGVLALGGCATKGFVRKGLDAQTAALQSERSERMAADEKLASDLTSLRNDLNTMRTEFGAKIAAVEEGLQFALPVHFAFDDSNVRPEDTAALDRFADIVSKHYAGATVTVEGFADPAGSAAYNKRLSNSRADAVRAYLTQKGIQAQLKTVGYGETRQVVEGAKKDDQGAELNRRVVFVIESPSAAQGVAALDSGAQPMK
ncbi:MAG TPA: OmpA family protein [Longimicrobiales bacterium]|nr:OmpA family protein [Longimicrobiales bacterium]